MKRKVSIIICLILVVLSCKNVEDKKDYNIKRTVNVDNIKEIQLNDILDIIELVPIETSESFLISHLTKLKYYDNKLFLLDMRQNAIFMIGLDGTAINKLHKIGRGPGEYINISDFTINPFSNNIEILDSRVLRTYDFNGNFLNEESIVNEEIDYVHTFEIIDNNTIAFNSIFAPKENIIFSRKKKKFIKMQSLHPVWVRENKPFGSFSPFYRNENEIFYIEAFSNKVYSVDNKGFHLAYEWDFVGHNFDYNISSIANKLKTGKISHDEEAIYMDKYVVQFQNNIQNDEYILTNFIFNSKPSTLIYNRKNNKYIIFNGDVSKLLMFTQICFLNTEEILVISNVKDLKRKPIGWFSEKDQELLNNLDLSDNPVILKLKLKNDFIKNL